MSLIAAAQAAEKAGEQAASGGLLSDAEVWVALAFVLVLAGLARPVLRAITTALDLRREKIRARLEEADHLRAEAQALLATYQKKQRDAIKEAQDILARAHADAARIAADGARNLDVLLKHREEQAMERLAQAESEALRDVRQAVVDIAATATERLLAENISATQANALVDAAIKDLPNRLH